MCRCTETKERHPIFHKRSRFGKEGECHTYLRTQTRRESCSGILPSDLSGDDSTCMVRAKWEGLGRGETDTEPYRVPSPLLDCGLGNLSSVECRVHSEPTGATSESVLADVPLPALDVSLPETGCDPFLTDDVSIGLLCWVSSTL